MPEGLRRNTTFKIYKSDFSSPTVKDYNDFQLKKDLIAALKKITFLL